MDTLTGHWSMFKNSIYIQIFQQRGGSDVDHHPDYKCQALQNMLNNEQIQQIRGRYSFNLVPREVFREMQEGKGYPEPFGIHNCPYCGARYTYVECAKS
jgi:hypothetical protein